MLRGTVSGLEFIFSREQAFCETAAAVRDRLSERPDFYAGSSAALVFEGPLPDGGEFLRFLAEVRTFGIALRGLYGPESFVGFAERHELPYLGLPPNSPVVRLEQRREQRDGVRLVRLSDAARSLDADFAGARADLAQRRKGGVPPTPMAAVPGPTPTLYHRGTIRGGKSLQYVGNIVVMGDVNPGAELVAGGDVVVFGALRGTAHAGAQGDAKARVVALQLMPTQLRIAAHIAADDSGRRPQDPEEAYVENNRIVIAPLRGCAE